MILRRKSCVIFDYYEMEERVNNQCLNKETGTEVGRVDEPELGSNITAETIYTGLCCSPFKRPQSGLDTKTDWLTVSSKVTLTLTDWTIKDCRNYKELCLVEKRRAMNITYQTFETDACRWNATGMYNGINSTNYKYRLRKTRWRNLRSISAHE
jgi:hypothetical protein